MSLLQDDYSLVFRIFHKECKIYDSEQNHQTTTNHLTTAPVVVIIGNNFIELGPYYIAYIST